MPIIEPGTNTAPVFAPDPQQIVAKYIDLTKFVSLLSKQSLFFCRLDKMEDKIEGTLPIKNHEQRLQWLIAFNQQQGQQFNEEELRNQAMTAYNFQQKLKTYTCINCWNKFQNESAALWKIYSDLSNGIMIKSSVERLHAAMSNTTEIIQLTEIRYLNYNSEVMIDGNTNYPIIHKEQAYSYENEIRLFHEIPSWNDSGFNWGDADVEYGIYLPVILDALIEEIIISPYSSKWFRELVEDLITKYGLNKPIRTSDLTLAGNY